MNSSEIGGPTSAFTRYVKPENYPVIKTITRRKCAFSRIKRLFSTSKEVAPEKHEDTTITSKGSNDSHND
jgi:hypothetical protein